MKISKFTLLFMLGIIACTAQENLDLNTQIEQAVLALPESFRAEATVMGYDGSTELSVIRKGTNTMMCLADDPNKEGFSVAGYHKDVDAFMQRGRDLKKMGKQYQEIFKIRGEQMEAGKFTIPSNSILYVVTGKYDEQDQPSELYQRFVVYIPYATVESSGIPLEPSYPGGPWIMDPGTYRAHIMINPTKVEEGK